MTSPAIGFGQLYSSSHEFLSVRPFRKRFILPIIAMPFSALADTYALAGQCYSMQDSVHGKATDAFSFSVACPAPFS